MTINLREAIASDASVIAEFNAAMAAETEGIALERDRLTAGVRAVLADRSKGFYLVAESQGEVVAQTLITYEWSDWRNGVFWWIQSVYVKPEFRGQGVFTRIYEYVAESARNSGNVCGLRLYVEHENERAQRTYERLGMRRTVYHMYEADFVLNR
jgi:ribosomal protein S18 acetylase RimI-like enzyme